MSIKSLGKDKLIALCSASYKVLDAERIKRRDSGLPVSLRYLVNEAILKQYNPTNPAKAEADERAKERAGAAADFAAALIAPYGSRAARHIPPSLSPDFHAEVREAIKNSPQTGAEEK